jgi:succinyl-CoA synthetase beta subunit
MKIHEFQARNLFKEYGIPVPDGVVCQQLKKLKRWYPTATG